MSPDNPLLVSQRLNHRRNLKKKKKNVYNYANVRLRNNNIFRCMYTNLKLQFLSHVQYLRARLNLVFGTNRLHRFARILC